MYAEKFHQSRAKYSTFTPILCTLYAALQRTIFSSVITEPFCFCFRFFWAYGNILVKEIQVVFFESKSRFGVSTYTHKQKLRHKVACIDNIQRKNHFIHNITFSR